MWRQTRVRSDSPKESIMCSYIVQKAALVGSAKGSKGWMAVDTAHVYYDHPYHAPLDHALAIDFVNLSQGGRERVAVELSADSARELVKQILAALETGDAAHAAAATPASATLACAAPAASVEPVQELELASAYLT
jgi:hypothetical protein